MPIYAYRCASCGHAKDVLQKMSDDPLTVCPACGKPDFQKQVTAAGFQLKGSGWYVTDFREGSKASPASTASESSDSQSAPAVSPATSPDGSASTSTEASGSSSNNTGSSTSGSASNGSVTSSSAGGGTTAAASTSGKTASI